MMENKKKVAFLIMAVAIIMIALIVWFVISRNRQNVANQNAGLNGQTPTSSSSLVINTSTPGTAPRDYRKFDISKEAPKAPDAEAVKKMAMMFAERFGSFSNHSNYANIDDLKIFMTASMGSWAEGYMADLKKQKSGSGEYYGVITRAVSATVTNFDDKQGQATIVVTTRRGETKGAVTSPDFSQDLTLKMIKEGGAWKVDSAVWQK